VHQARTISPSEWKFDKLPDDQVGDCRFYEFAREAPQARLLLETWRTRKRKLKAGAPMEPFLVMRVSLGILVYFPEFPRRAWQDITPGVRRARLERHWRACNEFSSHYRITEQERAFKVLDASEHRSRVRAMITRAETAKEHPSLRDRLRGDLEDLFCCIDWRKPTDAIIADFSAWVRGINRQRSKPKKDRSLRAARETLKNLGALRLLRHFKTLKPNQERAISAAIEHTQSIAPKPLYASRESWLRAAERAATYLEGVWGAQCGR